jgi:predicted ATPase/DNA-binding NarL/FixJ family response regulator
MRATLTRRLSNLPRELDPLLGREREAGQLGALLDDPAIRLVTVTGPGGVGKTRLALHVAALLERDRAVAFVPLAAVTDPALVVPAILSSLGAYADAGEAPDDRLVAAVDDEDVLIVLDNLEQVLEAAGTLGHLLRRCPGLTLLITSQAPLNIAGEQLFPLRPLAVPAANATDVAAIASADAVALFMERTRAANPAVVLDAGTAATIAAICRRLDGLPLGIELAAARTRILSPEALLARLSDRLRVLGGDRRDVPDRLRTLRNAVAWSYGLLAPDEQRLFRRLCVFADGATLEAVEAVYGPDAGARPAFDVLGALVDHSLVQAVPLPSGETRFVLLETLRDYGREQLERAGEEDAARLAHATWYIDLAEVAEPHLLGRGQRAWLEGLQPEIANIRAAVTWLLDSGREPLALRLLAALWRFCSAYGLSREARDWLQRALAAPSTRNAPRRAKALIAAGHLFEDQRQLAAARACFEDAREVAVATGDRLAESQALMGIGIVTHDAGDYAAALPIHERALALARETGHRHTITRSLGSLGAISYFQGRLDDAERYWEECRATLAELGDTITEAIVTGNLGALAFERADLARSEEMHRRALALQRQLRATRDLPYSLINLGGVATLRGDFALARTCVGEAIALLREAGNTAVEGVAVNVAAGLALAEGRIADAASLVLESTRLVTQAGDQRAVVENAEMLAEACALSDMPAAAAELLAAAARARRDLGAEATPFKQMEIARTVEAIGDVLDGDARIAAEAAGGAVGLDALPRRMATLAREIVGDRREPVVIESQPGPQPVDYGLTARELEVLRLLAQGLGTDAIGEALFISPRTATTHLTHILAKLGVPTRTAAVALALRDGIV